MCALTALPLPGFHPTLTATADGTIATRAPTSFQLPQLGVPLLKLSRYLQGLVRKQGGEPERVHEDPALEFANDETPTSYVSEAWKQNSWSESRGPTLYRRGRRHSKIDA